MNKKYLSVILFGALMLGSTGTFTSCKDYDDDINNLQTQITDIKTAVAELQKAIENGKYVSNIAAEGNGLKVTWNDGTSTVIENVINGETPEPGDVITFNPETGEILINGEASGYYAAKDAETEEVKVPYVNDEGVLVLIDEEGKEVVTGIRVAPVTAVVNADGSAVLTIIAADGTTQTVKVPSGASLISEIELLTDAKYQTVTNLAEIELLYWNADATTNWKGPRGNIPSNARTYSTNMITPLGGILTGLENIIYTRISPATVDASQLLYNVVDTKDNVASITLAAVRYDGLLTRAAENGLYSIYVVPGTYVGGASNFTSQFMSGTNEKALALKPTSANYKSLYNVAITPSLQTTTNLGNIEFDFARNPITPVGTDKTGTTVGNDRDRQVKVGQEVYVSVGNEHNLYDMYLSANQEDVELFGLVFSEDGRTFTATKSPDNVTDATFDLIIHTLPNKGGNSNIETTTITVEINRTLGAATYEKQTYQPTKVNDAFLVSADKLKESLGSDLNAWYASVDISNVLFKIYDDAACSIESDLAGAQLSVTMNENKNNVVTAANISTKLNYLKFQLNINKTTKPFKIGKTYYAYLSFKDKNTNKELNYVVVPFELTKPELSTILVKESGVFRDGGNLAYAYMYWQDAEWSTGAKYTNGNYYSRYYIDRAFTDMESKLANAKMTTYSFDEDDDNKVADTNVYTSDLATVSKATVSTRTRSYVQLNNVDANNDNLFDGYKKDLNVKFVGWYLDVQDNSWKYTQTYQFRVMSPILEGEAIAANDLIKVSATGRTKIYKEDVWAKTYNNDVKYDIFAKGTNNGVKVWYRDDIKNVTFSSGNVNVFEVTVATPTDPVAATATTEAVPSYIEVEGVSENTSKLNVAVDDIWGYTLKSSVAIQTTLNVGE